MKNFIFLTGIIIFLGMTVSCSEKMKAFDDKNTFFEAKSNVIKITNKTGFDLENLSLKMSYPSSEINMESSIAEGKVTNLLENLKIKSGERKDFPIPFIPNDSIHEINFEIDLKGDVVGGNKKVPFEISGALSALVASH